MNKTTSMKKLSLNKETLRTLTNTDLRQAVGGQKIIIGPQSQKDSGCFNLDTSARCSDTSGYSNC